jgi:hypothetical protein
MRSISLGIAFEGERLFAFGTIVGLSSTVEAAAILEAGVSLAVEGRDVFIRSAGRKLHSLDEAELDEFGRWSEDADRESDDDYYNSRFPREEFLAVLPDDPDLRPVCWKMAEFEIDERGELVAIVDSRSGTFGTPAIDPRSSSEDRRTAALPA